MSWRVARSLNVLLDEVNRARPRRDKASDGSIGDAAHASRSSDHNPWVKDFRGVGVVTARDFDEDHDGQVGAMVLAATVGRRDERVKYVIYEAKIYRSYAKPGIPAWTPTRYTGPNAHLQHIHVSVKPDQRLYDSAAPWGILDVRASSATPVAPVPAPEPIKEEDVMRHGESSERIRSFKHVVNRVFYETTTPGGEYGPIDLGGGKHDRGGAHLDDTPEFDDALSRALAHLLARLAKVNGFDPYWTDVAEIPVHVQALVVQAAILLTPHRRGASQ